MILEHIDQNYDAAYYAGEPIVLEYQETDSAGAPVQLGSRVFFLAIFRAEQPDFGFSVEGTTSDDGTYVTLELGADASTAFDTVRDGQYELSETITLTDGSKAKSVKAAGRLSVETSPSILLPPTGAPVLTGPVTRLTRTVRGAAFRVIRSQSGPPGPVGATGPGNGFALTPALDASDRTTEARAYFASGRGRMAPGDYLLTKINVPLSLSGQRDAVFEGDRARFVQSFDPSAPDTTIRTTMTISDARDSTWRGFHFAYASAPTTEGIITGVDTSQITFLPDRDPPLWATCDYFNIVKPDGSWRTHQYAQSNSDYAPDGTYGINPVDGQLRGSNGRYQIQPPALVSSVTAITATLPATFTAPAHGQPDGTSVTITLLDSFGQPYLLGQGFLLNVIDTDSFSLAYDDDTPLDLTGLGVTLAPNATVATVRVPMGVAVGDRVQVFCRKRVDPLIQLYACRRITLDLVIEQSVSVGIAGRDVEDATVNLVMKGRNSSIAGTAGGFVVNDVRGTLWGNFYFEGLGDDGINTVPRFLGRSIVNTPIPLVDSSFVADFAGSAAGARPSLPRLNDQIEFWDLVTLPNAPFIAATLTVTSLTPVPGFTGRYTVGFNNVLPSSFSPTAPIVNRSGIAKWRLDSVVHIGGTARGVLPQTHDAEIKYLSVFGLYSSAIRAQFPSSSVHFFSGGAKGGHRYGKIQAILCNWAYSSLACGVLVFRRFVPPRSPVSALSDWLYSFDDALVDGYGFTALNCSGANLRGGRLVLRRGGMLRSTQQQTKFGQDVIGNYDIFVEQSIAHLDTLDAYSGCRVKVAAGGDLTIATLVRPLAYWFEDATGYFTVLSGSGLRSTGTIAAGAVTVTAAKKVKVGHEARVTVRINGAPVDPSTYTANGTATLTFTTAPVASGAALAYSVTHDRC